MAERAVGLEGVRIAAEVEVAKRLQDVKGLVVQEGKSIAVAEWVGEIFPKTGKQPLVEFVKGDGEERALRVGVVLSGGQAPGGHNVIAGLVDALQQIHSQSVVIGFLDGPAGVMEGNWRELGGEELNQYRNVGGFDLIGSGRDKIETEEQFEKSRKVVEELGLNGLVIIGGDDSNTNAALIAEWFQQKGCSCSVVGVPKTIDGDLQNEWIPISFGFDTATKTYAETIGSIARDALSAKKYYYFIKVMGRAASHVALECALKTQPNVTLISEEVAEKEMTLRECVDQLCDVIVARQKLGKSYGVFVIPEGLIEFLKGTEEYLQGEKDPHGNIQVSKIETEKLLIDLVEKELRQRKFTGKFAAQGHFCGYEGRSCFPTIFDCAYCYNLGLTAAVLINNHKTGYIATLTGLTNPLSEWHPMGIPLTLMMHREERHGTQKPVIKKALVDLNGPAFHAFAKLRDTWLLDDHYQNPGPIQFFGPKELTHSRPLSLRK
ncbi:MAG: 6-phosphofructokinase [Chlamydiia bacterium]|nr:6-phosphofructokinase [Chlamydiia bacterium]